MVYMGVHWGEKYPCGKCGEVLANKKMWKRHTSACVQGKKVACPDCGKQYASSQGMKQHHKAKHGADVPKLDEIFVCPYCCKGGTVPRKVGLKTSHIVWIILITRVFLLQAHWLSCSRSLLHSNEEPQLPHVKHVWLEGEMGLSAGNSAGGVTADDGRVIG